MGFFEGLAKGLKGNENKEVLDMYDMEDEMNATLKSPNYREICFENTESNNGWYLCVKCGKKYRKKDMDIDHIVPQSKGGDSSKYNLQCICKHCNRSKRDDTSDTEKDLVRRRQELYKQRDEDNFFLNNVKQKARRK